MFNAPKRRAALSLLLTALLLLPTLASCTGGNGESNTQPSNTPAPDTAESLPDTAESDTASATESATETIFPSSLPTRDLNGQDFCFYVMGYERNDRNYSEEIYAKELNETPINDAVYYRNEALQEMYNFTISETQSGAGVSLDWTLSKLVSSGDTTYQVFMMNMIDGPAAMARGHLTDLMTVPYLSFSDPSTPAPWWSATLAKDLTLGGKLYSAIGDINVMANNATWAVFFNKDLFRDNGLEMPYDTVRAGRWTYDELYRLSCTIASDLNGDGVMEDDERWGIVGGAENSTYLFFGSGERFTAKDDDDYPIILDPTERMYAVMDKVMMIQQDRKSTLLVETSKKTYANPWSDLLRANFRNNLSGFYIAGLLTYTLMRDMEAPYGLLPLPKLEEAQADYYSTLHLHNASTVTIPVHNSNLEDTGFILEALAYESYKTLRPAYFNVALERRNMRDEESRDMLPLILDNRVLDPLIVYNWGSVLDTFSSMTISGTNDYASRYAGRKKAIQTARDRFIEKLN